MSSLPEELAGRSPAEPRAPRRGRRLVVAAWLLAGVAAVLTLLTVNVGGPDAAVDTPIVGRAAPAFDLETLDGGRLSLADLRGSPVVLNFWASWCIPCREEAPLLTAAARTFGTQGLRVVGIVYQDSAASARDFMDRFGQSYPGLLDPDGRTSIDYGVFGIPETFFIGRDGIVRARQVGPVTEAGLDRQIQEILR